MRRFCGLLFAVFFLSCGLPEPTAVSLQGRLTTEENDWFFTPCDSDEVYWVRVLASNPHFHLFRRVRELQAEAPERDIIAEFTGTVHEQATSAGFDRPHDHVLRVSTIVAVEYGSCPTEEPKG